MKVGIKLDILLESAYNKMIMKAIKELLVGKTALGSIFRVVILLILCAIPFWYNYQAVWISGSSMSPTYNDGQWTLMQRTRALGKNWRPERFDVVTVWSPHYNDLLCKRVIGLPGEVVEVREGYIYIDGERLIDSFGKGRMIREYLIDPDTEEPWWTELENVSPEKVEPGYVWVVGDDRAESVYGHFPINQIRGKIVLY